MPTSTVSVPAPKTMAPPPLVGGLDMGDDSSSISNSQSILRTSSIYGAGFDPVSFASVEGVASIGEVIAQTGMTEVVDVLEVTNTSTTGTSSPSTGSTEIVGITRVVSLNPTGTAVPVTGLIETVDVEDVPADVRAGDIPVVRTGRTDRPWGDHVCLARGPLDGDTQ